MTGGGAKFIGRNAPPRVQIAYETDTRGATEEVSLPFVMAVMGEFAGESDLPMIDERQFQEINVNNFEARMAGIKPKITLDVTNKLGDEDELLTVELSFESMADFSPGRIAERVKPLQELLRQRNQLKNFLNKIKTTAPGKRREAERMLLEAAKNPAVLQALVADGGAPDASGADDASAGSGGDEPPASGDTPSA
jgi:type VI secretion system protein ImpB